MVARVLNNLYVSAVTQFKNLKKKLTDFTLLW